MLRSLAVCALIIAVPTAATAQTVEKNLFNTAVAAARVGALAPLCGNFYFVDRVRTKDLAGAIVNEGMERFGRDTFERAFTGAMVKMQTEAQQSGAAIWCPKQREHFRKIGISDLIGGNLP